MKTIVLVLFLIIVPQFAHADLMNGLVGWWKMDEGTGTTSTADSSGNGHPGTLQNSPTWVQNCPKKNCLNFAGNASGQYVSISALNLTTSLATFTAWVNQTAAVDWAGICTSRLSTQPLGMMTRTSGELGYMWNNGDVSTWGWSSGLTIPNGQWVFVAIVVDATRVLAYLCSNGGCSSATNNIVHVSQTIDNRLDIGQDAYGSRFYDGSIDDVRVYNRALTSTEINDLYLGGLGRSMYGNNSNISTSKASF